MNRIGALLVDEGSHTPVDRMFAGLAVAAALLMPVGLAAAPVSGTVAVIAAPGQDAAGIVARAGGTILRMGGLRNVLVVRAGPGDFVARLYASGAWLVVDARLAGGCDPSDTGPRGGGRPPNLTDPEHDLPRTQRL